jgi:hypothetical protein
MNKFRSGIVLMILALLVALVPSAMAQDMTFGLSQEDFATLTAANAATASATSAQFDFTLDLSVAGAPDGDVEGHLTGTGLFDQTSQVFQIAVGGSFVANGETTPLDFELRAVDDTVYVMSPAFTQGEWKSISSDEMGEIGDNLTSSLPFNPTDLAGGDTSGIDSDAMESLQQFGEALNAFATLDPEQYIAMSRDGNTFTTDLDVEGFFSSPEFSAFLAQMAQMSAESGADTTGQMSAGQVAAMGAMMGEVFKDSTFTLTQSIDDQNMMNGTTIDLNMNVDPSQMGQPGDPVQVAFNFDLNLSDFNQTFSVDAPADATPFSAGS